MLDTIKTVEKENLELLELEEKWSWISDVAGFRTHARFVELSPIRVASLAHISPGMLRNLNILNGI